VFDTEASRERWSVRFALAALVISVGAVIITYLQLRSSDNALAVAKQSREDAVKQLEVSERPWLVTELTATKPIEFRPDGLVILNFTQKTTNIGHSVALNINQRSDIHPRYGAVPWKNSREEQKKLCDEERKLPEGTPTGDILFPQESQYSDRIFTFTKEIAKTDAILGFTVLGCVDYTFSFDPRHHQSGYIYNINRDRVPNAVEKLVIRRDPVGSTEGGFYAY
jgi:hypothetical protein